MIRKIKQLPFKVGDIVRFRNTYWAETRGYRLRSSYNVQVTEIGTLKTGFLGVVVRAGNKNEEKVGDCKCCCYDAFELVTQ